MAEEAEQESKEDDKHTIVWERLEPRDFSLQYMGHYNSIRWAIMANQGVITVLEGVNR